mgnify:CR=1 FL=1
MSKNEQMDIRSPSPTRGPASVTQGIYGEEGNLELVVADAEDGLWVHWFNSDPWGTPPVSGVEPGQWSGGLRFAEGTQYESAVIHQTPLGPHYLEVVAVRFDGPAESWYWSPGPGFQRRPGILEGAGARLLTEHESGFVLKRGDHVHVASAADYPHLVWTNVTPAGVEPGTLVVTLSTRGGRMLELVYRRDGHLVHDAKRLT